MIVEVGFVLFTTRMLIFSYFWSATELVAECSTQTCYHLSGLIYANFLQLLCSNWRNIMNLSPFKLDIDDLIHEFAEVPHSIEHNLLFSTCSVYILI